MVSGSLTDMNQIRDLIWEEIMANKCRNVDIQSICLEELYKYLAYGIGREF